MKKLFAKARMILVLILALSMTVNPVWAEELVPDESGEDYGVMMLSEEGIIASGTCGENLTWVLDDEGTLAISGSGNMEAYDYDTRTQYPWFSYRDKIKSIVIGEDVSSIGAFAFYNYTVVKSIVFRNTGMLNINEAAFGYETSVTSIDFGSGMVYPGERVFADLDSLESVHVPSNVIMNGSEYGVGSGSGMFYSCDNLKEAVVDCAYIGPFMFESCYALGKVTFTNQDVNCFYLEKGRSNPFNGSGVKPMTVTLVGNTCSKVPALAQKASASWGIFLTFVPFDEDEVAAHIAVEKAGVEPTCTKTGLSAGSVCSRCGTVIVEQEELPKSAHTPGEAVKENEVEATTTAEGSYELVTYCSSCGVELSRITEIVDKLRVPVIVASGTCGENMTWVLDDEGTLTISGSGKMDNYSSQNSAPWHEYRKSIIAVKLEEGITSIGSYAYYYSSYLKQITLPSSLISIEKSAFENSYLPKIEIPDNVTSIENRAFYSCYELVNIKLPDKLEKIGDETFMNCRKLTGIVIPKNVKSIGSDAFNYCSRLVDVTILANLEKIEKHLFYQCSALVDIDIPESVTTIGIEAFSYCKSLSNIKIPKRVMTIEDSAFSHCTSLNSIEFSESLTSIGNRAFSYCTSLNSIEFPESLTSIGNSAFGGCTSLNSIKFSEGLTKIAGFAFRECTSLKSVEIPKSVTSLGQWVFDSCTNLSDAYFFNKTLPMDNYLMPKTTVIHGYRGSTAEEYCREYGNEFVSLYERGTCGTNLKWQFFVDSLEIFGTGDMYDYSEGADKRVPWEDLLNEIRNVIINPEVASISKGLVFNDDIIVYGGNDVVKKYCDENTLTYKFICSLDNYDHTTAGVVSEEKATCTEPGHVYRGTCSICGEEVISETAPLGHKWDNGVVTKPVTEENDGEKLCTCERCGETKTVIIRKPVSVGGKCGKNLTWRLEGNLLTISGSGSMYDYALEDVAPWFEYSDLIEQVNISGASGVSGGAFWDCTNITKVTMSTSVTSIGMYAFKNCENLKSISIPKNVTSIGEGAFAGCESLVTVSIPYGVKKISVSAFEDCTGLMYIKIPASVKTIEDMAFAGCMSLPSLTIPDSVTWIGEGIAEGCYSLSSILIPSSVTTINGLLTDNYYTIIYGTAGSYAQQYAYYNDFIFLPSDYFGVSYFEMATKESTQLDVLADEELMEHLVWESSNPSVVSVDNTGTIKARKYDKDPVRITVKLDSGEIVAECLVQTRFYDVAGVGTKAEATKDKPYQYYYDAVYWAAEHEPAITKGYDLLYYGVDRNCTRDEFVLFLYRLAGEPAAEPAKATETFSDVSKVSNTFKKAIAWAVEQGITKGYSDGTFGVGRPITRQESMIMIYRFAGKPSYTKTKTMNLTDVVGQFKPTSDTYKAIEWAYNMGITNGYSSQENVPAGYKYKAPCFGNTINCNRQDMITFLYRYADKYGKLN